MPLNVSQVSVEVTDKGVGAQIEVELTINFRGTLFNTKVTGPELALTPDQTDQVQNAMDFLRTRAIAVLKADIGLP